jgi:hypothetical protein
LVVHGANILREADENGGTPWRSATLRWCPPIVPPLTVSETAAHPLRSDPVWSVKLTARRVARQQLRAGQNCDGPTFFC